MNLKEALWQDPERMGGAVCFHGTRVPVETLFHHLMHGEIDQFYEGFPNVSSETVEAVLNSSLELIEKQFPLRKSA